MILTKSKMMGSVTTAAATSTIKMSNRRKRPARAMLVSAAGALALASFSGEHVFVSAEDAPENNNHNEIRSAPGNGSSGGNKGKEKPSLAESLALYDVHEDASSDEDYPSCDALADVFVGGGQISAACPSDDAIPCSGIEAVTEHCRAILLADLGPAVGEDVADNDDAADVDPAALRGCVAYVGWHDDGLACCPSTSCFEAFHDQQDDEVDEDEEDYEDGYYYEDYEEEEEDEEDDWEYIVLSPHEPVPEVGTPYFADDEPTSAASSSSSTSSDSSEDEEAGGSPDSTPNDRVDSADFDTSTSTNNDDKDTSASNSGDTYQFDPISDADELRVFLRIMAAELTPAEIEEVERRLYEHYYPDGEEEDYDDEEEEDYDYDYEDNYEEDEDEANNDDAAANGGNNNLLVNETHDVDDPTTTTTTDASATKNFSADEAVVDISRRAGQQRTDQ